MKALAYKIAIMFTFLFGMTSASLALPKCPTWDILKAIPFYKKHCVGIEINKDGSGYVGEFKNGERNGEGTYTWPSGDRYHGNWVNGKKNGEGTYTWPSGMYYYGDWVNDKRTGEGILYNWNHSKIKEGVWKDGNFQYEKDVGFSPSHISQILSGLNNLPSKEELLDRRLEIMEQQLQRMQDCIILGITPCY